VQIGALVQRDFLTPEIGNRIQLAVLRHQDRSPFGAALIGDIADRGARSLSEDRRGLAGVAEVDRAGIERFGSGGPDGNSVHTTLKPAACNLSSSVPCS